MNNVAINTVVPILILIFFGFLSRKLNLLKKGDERVLSSYVYYFALPSLFFVEIYKTKFTEDILIFIITGILPLIFLLGVYWAIYLLFRIRRDTIYLLSLSTVFGSLAFFGIPFIMFAFPAEGEKIGTLAAAMISVAAVTISITLLELYRYGESINGIKIIKRLSKNPLIFSIMLGILFSLSGVNLPSLLLSPLHMIGKTTSVVAIFMLGVFLYGRKYEKLKLAFGLSLLRIVALPAITFIVVSYFIPLSHIESTTLVLMNAMPMAVSMIVLSHRYKFFENVIASVIMISSISAVIYLNIWLFILGF